MIHIFAIFHFCSQISRKLDISRGYLNRATPHKVRFLIPKIEIPSITIFPTLSGNMAAYIEPNAVP
jgi:hypothetical protein